METQTILTDKQMADKYVQQLEAGRRRNKQYREAHIETVQAKQKEYKRNKRASNPEWVQQEREKSLARYYRKKGLAVSAETSPAEVCGFAEIWDEFS